MSEEITQEGISQPEATEAVVENAPKETPHLEVNEEDTRSDQEKRKEIADQERVLLNPRTNTLESIIAARKE